MTTGKAHRRALALGAALATILATASGCGKDSESSATPTTTAPNGSGTTMLGGNPRAPAPDQSPPKGANGLAFRDGLLWVADLNGGQIVVVDPANGAILARYGKAQGISATPDDLAVARDGSVWWTGFDTGVVGRISTDGKSTDMVTTRPGANPITVGPDGSIYVGIAVTGDGLFVIDPAAPDPPREIAPAIGNVNAFAFGLDGALYGPAFSNQEGKVVRIDVADGKTTDVAKGFPFPDSLRFDASGQAFVLSTLPPRVDRLDLLTGEVTLFATPPTKAVDNMAWGPDGNLYVSGFNEPTITVIDPEGKVLRTLSVGRR